MSAEDTVTSTKSSWLENMKVFADARALTMLFLGFSAGLPILMIFSSLGLWLREAGVERSSVTYFSWAALGYSFKFVWAPLVDRLPLPVLGKALGRRRSWMLLSQIAIMASICIMALVDPLGWRNKAHSHGRGGCFAWVLFSNARHRDRCFSY